MRSPCRRGGSGGFRAAPRCRYDRPRVLFRTVFGEADVIHHVSIPARGPQHVAGVLAELMKGACVPFGPLEGAYMAASGDAHGSMIEVYPDKATLDIPSN